MDRPITCGNGRSDVGEGGPRPPATQPRTNLYVRHST